MTRKKALAPWIKAWILLPLSILGLLVAGWQATHRWQMLHGTQAVAVVRSQLGKEGSGSNGVYHLLAEYQQPQHGVRYVQIATNRFTHDELTPGKEVLIGYAEPDPQHALLASEWSLSGKLLLFSAVCLMVLVDGLVANRRWRSGRP